MKKFFGLFCVAILLGMVQCFGQNIRSNKFELPVVNNEIGFQQLDTVHSATKDDLYLFSKDWLAETFDVQKLNRDDKKNGNISATVHFKIDDENIKDPLYYTAAVTIDFKDGVARINLHSLNYTTGEGRGKNAVNVTYQVKEQVRSRTDELYPATWNSLKRYGSELMDNFKNFITEKESSKL